MIPGKTYTPQEIRAIAWRRKWLIVVPLVLAAAGAFEYARRLPDQFRSEAVILVISPRVSESYVRSTFTSRVEDRLQSIAQEVLSRARLAQIVRDLNLYPTLRSSAQMDDVIDRMRNVDIGLVTRSDSFRVSYVANDPRQAQQVAERLAALFIDESLKDRETLAEGTNDFLKTQLDEARGRLIDNEKKLERYRREHGNELPSQLESNLQAMNGAQMQFQALADSLGRDHDRRLVMERRAADLEAQAAAEPPLPAVADAPSGSATIDEPAIAGATHAQQLDAARKLLQDLSSRLKPTHPDIKRVQRTIADLEEQVRRDAVAIEEREAANKASGHVVKREDAERQAAELREELANLDRQIQEKELQQKGLQAAIAEYQRRAEAAPTRQSELVELTRDYSTIQTLYGNLLGKNEDAKISATLERSVSGERFRMIDPPRLPVRPFAPARLRYVQLGAVLGLLCGLGLIVFLEYWDTSLKTDDDVLTVLSLPVLALIPVMQSVAERRQQRRRRILLSTASTAALLFAVGVFVMWKLKAGL